MEGPDWSRTDRRVGLPRSTTLGAGERQRSMATLAETGDAAACGVEVVSRVDRVEGSPQASVPPSIGFRAVFCGKTTTNGQSTCRFSDRRGLLPAGTSTLRTVLNRLPRDDAVCSHGLDVFRNTDKVTERVGERRAKGATTECRRRLNRAGRAACRNSSPRGGAVQPCAFGVVVARTFPPHGPPAAAATRWSTCVANSRSSTWRGLTSRCAASPRTWGPTLRLARG